MRKNEWYHKYFVMPTKGHSDHDEFSNNTMILPRYDLGGWDSNLSITSPTRHHIHCNTRPFDLQIPDKYNGKHIYITGFLHILYNTIQGLSFHFSGPHSTIYNKSKHFSSRHPLLTHFNCMFVWLISKLFEALFPFLKTIQGLFRGRKIRRHFKARLEFKTPKKNPNIKLFLLTSFTPWCVCVYVAVPLLQLDHKRASSCLMAHQHIIGYSVPLWVIRSLKCVLVL